MALEDSRELSGPQLRYSRPDEGPAEDALARALDLARKVEELLEDTRSVAADRGRSHGPPHDAAHSTRMARAMAASLVDELEVLVRPARHTGMA